jgi:hypothetical protein
MDNCNDTSQFSVWGQVGFPYPVAEFDHILVSFLFWGFWLGPVCWPANGLPQHGLVCGQEITKRPKAGVADKEVDAESFGGSGECVYPAIGGKVGGERLQQC